VVGAGDTFLVCDNEEKIYFYNTREEERESRERERGQKFFFFERGDPVSLSLFSAFNFSVF
jgi:hypothetical protein